METLETLHTKMTEVLSQLSRVILGQQIVLEQILTCLLAGGHVLVEGVPGLGKTLAARALARLVDAKFKRIQFTPDLLPSDIIGTNIFNSQGGSFTFYKGPVFTEILLADEINRTPPKSQAALLEAMEERQVTVYGSKRPLSELFFVMATQNPIEYEGTYPLPETQLDRFMMKVTVTYPPEDAELDIVRQYSKGAALHDVDHTIESAVISRDELLGARAALDKITVSEEILSYIHKIIIETRDPGHVQLGASPRAAIGLLKSARALAAIRGMSFITPEEVKDVSVPVLRHRVILRPEALIDGLTSDYYLDNILRRVPVPR